MKLNRSQVLKMLKTEKIGRKPQMEFEGDFKNFRSLLDRISLNEKEKDSIEAKYREEFKFAQGEDKKINFISILLDDKIEMGSDDFWELFFFRKHKNNQNYKNPQWNDLKTYNYESIEMSKKIEVLKEFKISSTELEYFFEKFCIKKSQVINGKMLFLWFEKKVQEKDKTLDQEMRDAILKYDETEKRVITKAKLLNYFNELEELENLYIRSKDNPYKASIAEHILRFKDIKEEPIELFDETPYHLTIYRKDININANSLIYSLKKDRKVIDRVILVIGNFLTNKTYQIKPKEKNIGQKYIVEGYSPEQLEENMEMLKKAFEHLPSLILKKEYFEIFRENPFVDYEKSTLFSQYIKTADLYKKIDEKLPVSESKNKEPRHKI